MVNNLFSLVYSSGSGLQVFNYFYFFAPNTHPERIACINFQELDAF